MTDKPKGAEADPAEERGGVEEGPGLVSRGWWYVSPNGREIRAEARGTGRFIVVCKLYSHLRHNAAAIVHRVNMWPRLYAEVEALRGEVAELRSTERYGSLLGKLAAAQAERDAAIARAEKAEAMAAEADAAVAAVGRGVVTDATNRWEHEALERHEARCRQKERKGDESG